MKKIFSIIFLMLVYACICFAQAPVQRNSQWVFPAPDGKLKYKTTEAGDRIMDFSHAGYMGGGVALPIVPVKLTVKPTGKDDTETIQSAIDQVAKMPLVNGFRGAVQLAAGNFMCSATIFIRTSGIVLKGTSTKMARTTINMTGGRHTAIIIGKNNSPITDDEGQANNDESTSTSAQTFITEAYVPAGVNFFTVADASAFSIGDVIEIKKPVTAKWVEFMQMHNLKRDGRPQTWIGTNRQLILKRKIIAITGNKLTVDVPLSDALDSKHLNPPGVIVHKIKQPERITQVGVEDMHIKCPPLEISYGNAPYSGIRIAGDDCWVRNVSFEETMNTTALLGNRITMQEVEITHTYPNLGASKPADFSFEGSQNLLDRCKSTGGNTYFVWASSLIPGPNVLLNCTFRGHGSRIQPHQRWATGLLVDNCTIADGGIDFMNRGVAGSGHGWTMGWAVAWNSIAKTYIIQAPPGTANWAVGCIGRREQTARLFDSTPLLPEGYFDSHGSPVALQSLYLAQLQERIGIQAIKNLGYASNSKEHFHNKSVKPLPPQKTETHSQFGTNLALHRPVNTNNVRGKTREFGGEKAIDGDDATYWATNDSITRASIEIDMEGPVEINALEISEALGNRVLEYKIEGQENSDWTLLAQGTTIGKNKTHQFATATVWKVRLTILKATNFPAISEIGLYNVSNARKK